MVIEFMLSVMFIWLCYTIDYERKIAGQSGIPMFGRLFDAARTFLNVPLAPPKNRKGRDRSSRRKRVSENCQKSGKEERLPSPASDKKHGSKHRRGSSKRRRKSRRVHNEGPTADESKKEVKKEDPQKESTMKEDQNNNPKSDLGPTQKSAKVDSMSSQVDALSSRSLRSFVDGHLEMSTTVCGHFQLALIN
ncbi:hypothetical protein QR680_015325 [Steinernema hermaphroditum]|uniref:Bestrophin homolog n=1 Tax=Steinernema hermaphroditum TaxID=289476 RepID=A0AA39H879_9BILA|nr:hypothetical protein QR680_015325 [Steinernema hermaphroditum]